jgi:hypothetical protein
LEGDSPVDADPRRREAHLGRPGYTASNPNNRAPEVRLPPQTNPTVEGHGIRPWRARASWRVGESRSGGDGRTGASRIAVSGGGERRVALAEEGFWERLAKIATNPVGDNFGRD